MRELGCLAIAAVKICGIRAYVQACIASEANS